MRNRCIGAAAAAAMAACAQAPARASRAAPDVNRLAATDLHGAPVAIGGPGPVRLVELWATWCEPCERAAAAARPVLARHPRVTAYAIAVDSDRASIAQHAARAVGDILVVQGGA